MRKFSPGDPRVPRGRMSEGGGWGSLGAYLEVGEAGVLSFPSYPREYFHLG